MNYPKRGVDDLYALYKYIFTFKWLYESRSQIFTFTKNPFLDRHPFFRHSRFQFFKGNVLFGRTFLPTIGFFSTPGPPVCITPVSYTHLRAHETDSYLVCRLL